MVEVTIPDGYPFQEGHQPEVRDVLLDLYRLTMIYLGDQVLYAMTHSSLMPEWTAEDWDPVDDPLSKLSSEFQWTEASTPI
jgi:hypothetical protein